jgi:glycosyltransferase involved in cell wall biosynthesis
MDTGESSPLNILFVQDAPCIRNYKMATALRGRGHRVTLGYTRGRLSQVYPGLSDDVYTQCIHIQNLRQLWDISNEYQLVHCHNEPDTLSVSALAGDAPVIHDTHDLISLRANGDANLTFFEGVANRGAHGRVYTTPYQQEEARNLYGADGPSLVLYNYVSQADLPKRFLPKLSADDGRVHIVYEGGMGGPAHRDFIQLFLDLAGRGIQVHMYPARFDQRLADFFASVPNTHYQAPVSPHEIMEVMTQYDVGIIPFNLEKGNKRFLDSTIANKLFEYLAAGLPVVASPLRSYTDYFAQTPVGRTFQNADDLVAGLPELLKLSRDRDLRTYARTYEDEIGRLEAFYQQIIQGGPIRQPVRSMTPRSRKRKIYYSKPVSQIVALSARGSESGPEAEEAAIVPNRPQPGELTSPSVERGE